MPGESPHIWPFSFVCLRTDMFLSKNYAIKVLQGGKYVGSNTLRAKNSLK